jgi:hypothetical protein
MGKKIRSRYTPEFKLEAVRIVRSGKAMAVASATLGLADQTLYKWVKADSGDSVSRIVLQIDLLPNLVSWQFVGVDQRELDSGAIACKAKCANALNLP